MTEGLELWMEDLAKRVSTSFSNPNLVLDLPVDVLEGFIVETGIEIGRAISGSQAMLVAASVQSKLQTIS